MEWARILAYITATVDQELLLRNEYLAAEKALAALLDRCRAAKVLRLLVLAIARSGDLLRALLCPSREPQG
jgi:hypothetical protein